MNLQLVPCVHIGAGYIQIRDAYSVDEQRTKKKYGVSKRNKRADFDTTRNILTTRIHSRGS